VATKAKDVVRELEHFKTAPRYVIPMHWLFRSPRKFYQLLEKELPGIGCIVPEKGQVVIG
jgi:hypothetical protein